MKQKWWTMDVLRSRNQEKLAYAESEYADAANLVTKKIEANGL